MISAFKIAGWGSYLLETRWNRVIWTLATVMPKAGRKASSASFHGALQMLTKQPA